MEQGAFAFLGAAVFGLAVLSSYLRHRFRSDDGEENAASVRRIVAEAKGYFGVDTSSFDDGAAKAFDLAPLELLSGVASKRPSRKA